MAKDEDDRIRVLVVDDSAFARRSLMRMFEASTEIRIVDIASDGEMALAKVRELRPDVVTLDVQMPVMDGLTALARIMEENPTPVIMLSSCTGKGGEQTMAALELGAVDFVDKCSVGGPMDISALTRELTEKIKVAACVRLPVAAAAALPPSRPGLGQKPHHAESDCPRREGDRLRRCQSPFAGVGAGAELVLVGTSTGGPAALSAVLSRLPAQFPCPILVVQHMPAGFTAPLAERLDRICAIAVKEAQGGERLLAGCVYLAPAGQHLKVRRSGEEFFAWLDTEPGGTPHRPSVDVLFKSAAAVSGKGCLAFVLTGMGSDGAAGAVELKKSGARVFVESEETSVVHGMPGAAAAAVQVDGSLPLREVARTMVRLA